MLNEEPGLDASLRDLDRALRSRPHVRRNVFLVDGGSRDGSRAIARRWCRRCPGWRVMAPRVPRDMSHAVRTGVAAGHGDAVLILPADCLLAAACLRELDQALRAGADWGGFAKRYAPAGVLLRLFAFLQNAVLLRWRGQPVWTNAMFVRRGTLALAGGVPCEGFLDDVVLADRLRRLGRPAILRGPVLASSRRYHATGTLRRIVRNGLILACYRWLGLRPARLRRWYLR